MRVLHARAMRAALPRTPDDIAFDEQLVADLPPWCVLSRAVLPPCVLKDRYAAMLADVRVMLAGLALLRYRREHGTWPADLAAAGVGRLVDPFSAQPLQYRHVPPDVIVYSVGPNHADDGGAPAEERGTGDIPWRLHAP